MWQFYIIPSREERIRRGMSISFFKANFEEVKEEHPNIRMLFTDSEDKKSDCQSYI